MSNKPRKSRKVKKIIWKKIYACTSVIQKFPNLIIENFMETIIAYRREIEDVQKCLKMDNKL